MELKTITGLVPVQDIKLADAHAHVWIAPPKGVAPKHQFLLADFQSIDAELKDFQSAGGTTFIDCQPGYCGRDAGMLAKFSETHGLHITATTGFHVQRYYPADSWIWSTSEQLAADYFVSELTSGLQEYGDGLATTIKVGFEGKIEGQTRILMEAAADAARQTGAALLIHTEQGLNVEELPVFFEDRQVPSQQLYFCHLDKRPDFGLHRELTQAGALLGYDTFARSKYKPRQTSWPLLMQMVQSGYEDHIAIGLDMARSDMWQHYGGEPGLVYLPDRILPLLHSEGLSETVVSKLTAQNIAQFLVRRKNS